MPSLLKTTQAAGLIGEIRALAVELRTPKLAEKIKKAKICIPVLDQETRFNKLSNFREKQL